MVAILKDLHEEDHFALILFDDNIKTWKNHLTKATKNNITEAIEYTQGIRDSGGKYMEKNDIILGGWISSLWLSFPCQKGVGLNTQFHT